MSKTLRFSSSICEPKKRMPHRNWKANLLFIRAVNQQLNLIYSKLTSNSFITINKYLLDLPQELFSFSVF